nr:MAG TPA: hypothetical protein [Caudoviricetes sp.]
MVLRLCGLLVGLLVILQNSAQMMRTFDVWIGRGRCSLFLVKCLLAIWSIWAVLIS